MCGLLGAGNLKTDMSGYMSEHQTALAFLEWCAPLSVPKLIDVDEMRADSPGFPHQKPIRVLQMSGALVLHCLFAERPESKQDGENREVGLGYINPSLDCTSCFLILRTWLCFYQNIRGAASWSAVLLFLPKIAAIPIMVRVGSMSAFHTKIDLAMKK